MEPFPKEKNAFQPDLGEAEGQRSMRPELFPYLTAPKAHGVPRLTLDYNENHLSLSNSDFFQELVTFLKQICNMTLILSESLIQNTVKYFYRELGG
jgi:hypothetical protein